MMVNSCGQQGAPDGGPPDKTPPVVLRTYPLQVERHVQTESIQLEFSKYINKQAFAPNIFLSPQVPYKLVWSGKEAELRFTERLDSNTTYALTLGSDYTDWRGNKPEKSFTLMFSTGKDLDSATLKGIAYMPDYSTTKQEGVYLFVYRLPEEKSERDTFDIRTHRPKYRSQPGKDGRYEIPALAAGTYRVAIVKDEFRDGVVDVGTDAYGLLTQDIVLSSRGTITTNIRMDKAADTKAPQVVSASAITPNTIRVRFSKKIDSLSIRAQGFAVFDSTSVSVTHATISAHTVPLSPQSVDVYMQEPLPAGQVWRIRAITPRDSAGNAMNDSLHTATIIQAGNASALVHESEPLRLMYCTLADSAQNIALQPRVRIAFSEPLDERSRKALRIALYAVQSEAQSVQASVTVPSTRATVSSTLATLTTISTITSASLSTASISTQPMMTLRREILQSTAHWLTPNVISIAPLMPLASNMMYELVITSANITSLVGHALRDTTLRRTFRSVDTGPFGSAIGTLRDTVQITSAQSNTDRKAAYILVLQSKDRQTIRTLTLQKPGAFEFNDLPAGGYMLYGFYDADGNGYHSAGQAHPLVFAERFAVVPTEITIRQRWTVEGIILDFSK